MREAIPQRNQSIIFCIFQTIKKATASSSCIVKNFMPYKRINNQSHNNLRKHTPHF